MKLEPCTHWYNAFCSGKALTIQALHYRKLFFCSRTGKLLLDLEHICSGTGKLSLQNIFLLCSGTGKLSLDVERICSGTGKLSLQNIFFLLLNVKHIFSGTGSFHSGIYIYFCCYWTGNLSLWNIKHYFSGTRKLSLWNETAKTKVTIFFLLIPLFSF